MNAGTSFSIMLEVLGAELSFFPFVYSVFPLLPLSPKGSKGSRSRFATLGCFFT